MLDNCFRFAPRDSIPGLISKICKYLKDHPGWSEYELEEQIKKFISETGVESFNGRTGVVTLDQNDVNNLKIASAYFAEGNESIDSLDLVSLYNQGVRFIFTDFNSVTSGYNLAFVLEYFSGSGNVVYYPMSTGSGGGGNIVSVNGKTGVVELSLADIIGSSGVQVKICTEEEFTSTTTETWNSYYNEGYRIVCVVNSSVTSINHIYILKQDENNHTPIGLSTGASDAYTPTNPPPYPVSSVNGKTGVVTGLYDIDNPPPYPVSSVNGKTGSVGLKVVDVSKGNSTDKNAYIFIDEDEEYPEVVSTDSAKLGGQLPSYYATAESVSNISYNNAGAHNSIYRGKNLGSAVTAAQWEEIGAGTFGDMFVGDYWYINSIYWRIGGFNYWYNYGDTACSKPHVLIVPDQNLLNADGSTTHWMNATDTTSGAYVGSDFYTGNNGNTGKAQCRSMAQSAFGSAHILTHREYLQNAVTNGYESGGAWYDSDVEIMNEKMVYGCEIFSNQTSGTNIPAKYAIDNAQIPLFALDHSRICNRADWWLRGVVSGSYFAAVYGGGDAGYTGASHPWIGVRPAFAICA